MCAHVQKKVTTFHEFRCQVTLVHPVSKNCCEMASFQTLSKLIVQLSFKKRLQRLAVKFSEYDKMDQHGVNPTLSIFLSTPFPVAMQGLDATTL